MCACTLVYRHDKKNFLQWILCALSSARRANNFFFFFYGRLTLLLVILLTGHSFRGIYLISITHFELQKPFPCQLQLHNWFKCHLRSMTIMIIIGMVNCVCVYLIIIIVFALHIFRRNIRSAYWITPLIPFGKKRETKFAIR